MTTRAQLFAIAGLIGLFAGLGRGQNALSLLSISCLIWILSEWLLFFLNLRFQLPNLKLSRMLNSELESNRSLWADRTVDVQCRISKGIRLFGVTLDLLDVVPENLEMVPIPSRRNADTFGFHRTGWSKSWIVRKVNDFIEGADANSCNHLKLGLFAQSDWRYTARVRAAGNVVFPGFRLTFRSTHALFKREMFIKCEQVFRALPSFVDAGEYRSLTKKSNVIPRHGIHRLHRSGMGSELLELREYVPGDPFKSIAWKVSAKRDQWMTRQYESEVPTRVQLIVDGTSISRVGGFGFRLLDQMTYVAASIGRMATNASDPVGGALFDERGTRRLPPMSGEKGFQILLRALGDFSVNPSPPPSLLNQRMMDAVWGLLSQRYPELLDFKVNQIPFALLPVLPSTRARRRQRFLVAGALSEIYDLSTREQVSLIQNDTSLARRIQDLLNRSGIPWINPVVSPSERSDHDPFVRMNQLSDCILSVVAHARDNEVIVVMSDLLNYVGILEFVLPAVKLAIAKHHRVSFVCPTSTFQRPSRNVSADFTGNWSTRDLLFVAEQARLQIQMEQLQREIHRCGASVSLSGEKNAIRLIMSEIEAAKSGRSKFQGVSR